METPLYKAAPQFYGTETTIDTSEDGTNGYRKFPAGVSKFATPFPIYGKADALNIFPKTGGTEAKDKCPSAKV